MTDRSRIDAAELHDVRLTQDGSRLLLLIRGATGQPVSISLPTNCLGAMLAAMPRQVATGTVHSLDSWNMALAEDGQGMILTLCTSEGLTVSFSIKPWQAQGMATVATYGGPHETTPRSVH
jgi:hypothetical protein